MEPWIAVHEQALARRLRLLADDAGDDGRTGAEIETKRLFVHHNPASVCVRVRRANDLADVLDPLPAERFSLPCRRGLIAVRCDAESAFGCEPPDGAK